MSFASSSGWFDRGVITNHTVLACERTRLLRASRLADDVLPIAGGRACRRAQGAWPNVAAGFDIDPPMSGEQVERIVGWFGEIGKDARVELSDRAGAPVFATLAAAGFRLKDLVSILTLDMPDRAPMAPPADGVRLLPVSQHDEATCRQLAEVLTQQFAPPGTVATAQDIAANLAGLRHTDVTALGAFVGDRCVGGGLLDTEGGVGVLYAAAVAPEYRRRGVQRALIAGRLAMARERGTTLAFIETTSGGPTHRNASAMGFRPAYTRALMMRPR